MRASSPAIVLLMTGLLAGCVAPDPPNSPPPSADPGPPPFVAPPVPSFDGVAGIAGLDRFVDAHPYRAHNSPDHVAARETLAAELVQAGLAVWRQPFQAQIPMENLCGIKLGERDPQTWVVLGAHYDTFTWDELAFYERDESPPARGPGSQASQGAYDDGSGTWILVELARAYAALPSYRSIAFCFFDGEEWGLKGSEQVAAAISPEGDGSFPWPVAATRGMINLDMFGITWPARTPIAVILNSQELFERIDGFRQELGVPDDMYVQGKETLGTSDYTHWSRQAIPTVFFYSDFESLGVPGAHAAPAPAGPTPAGAYPFWHWVDTIETMETMAGGRDVLEAGYGTALAVVARTLDLMANHPNVELPAESDVLG